MGHGAEINPTMCYHHLTDGWFLSRSRRVRKLPATAAFVGADSVGDLGGSTNGKSCFTVRLTRVPGLSMTNGRQFLTGNGTFCHKSNSSFPNFSKLALTICPTKSQCAARNDCKTKGTY